MPWLLHSSGHSLGGCLLHSLGRKCSASLSAFNSSNTSWMNEGINEYRIWANKVHSVQLLICFIPCSLRQAEGQGYVFVAHQARAAWKHPISYWFLIPYYLILLSLSLLLFDCTERKNKSALMTMMLPFLHLLTRVAYPSPLSRVWWPAPWAVCYMRPCHPS